eukprot:CAMPEP_0119053936 /NCGR_PEP_ID=MMETSP1177-20130426/74741_1 /TAXON_ID=2985 /ORGANISM="Ochromonas sp, Strain CCMP1899" /LENGTH=584 /DNA_ID=CAMNT_0007034019 /DNA_START=163 /DNA_END=1914 /DNA_ORIENTATION=-
MEDSHSLPQYVASLDQGTSSTRFMVFDLEGSVIANYQEENTQMFPKPGQVEHDPIEMWQRTQNCIAGAMRSAKLESSQIQALGITNQRETTLVWNKITGVPYNNAIVWNDDRTASICDNLAQVGGKDRLRSKTGLPIAPYFSASKLMWLLDNIGGLREDADNGIALFGTVDTWLIWNLTGGLLHMTDVTNASRTMMMNINSLEWDEDLLMEMNIPLRMLPNIRPSSMHFGNVAPSAFRSAGLPLTGLDELAGVAISGVLGDQQAALFGQTCFAVGEAQCTYGTGAFLLMSTGNVCVKSTSGLLTTVAYQLGGGEVCYALEGSVSYAGLLIQWLRDNLKVINSLEDSENVASEVPDNGGVYFVPAFSGLYAPYWRDDARGLIVGLTGFNTKAHIVRAALEAAAFQVKELIDAMDLDLQKSSNSSSSLEAAAYQVKELIDNLDIDEGRSTGGRLRSNSLDLLRAASLNLLKSSSMDLLKSVANSSNSPSSSVAQHLKVGGGMTNNNLLMQFQSDLLGLSLYRPYSPETTALGAAFAAGLAVGYWESVDELRTVYRSGKQWDPRSDPTERQLLLKTWQNAVSRSLGW